MKNNVCVYVAIVCITLCSRHAVAGDVSLSLNLEFNDPLDQESGGTWTVVGKGEDRGIATVVLSLQRSTVNFDVSNGFLAPPEYDSRFAVGFANVLQIAIAAIPTRPPSPRPLDLGVIGSFPSSYKDHPQLTILDNNPDLGSFTGGLEFATGTFDPGVVPTWIGRPGTGDSFRSHAFLYQDEQGTLAEADVLTTVRFVAIPEPSTLLLLAIVCLGGLSRLRRRPLCSRAAAKI